MTSAVAPSLELTASERRALRARAHSLQPTATIGSAGLSAAVLREIAAALHSHELIKVRAASDDRSERSAWLVDICQRLGASPVQAIGKIFVLFKQRPVAEAEVAGTASRPARPQSRSRRPPAKTQRAHKRPLSKFS